MKAKKQDLEEMEVNISVGSSSRNFYWDCKYQGKVYSGRIVEYYDSQGNLEDTVWDWYDKPTAEIREIVEYAVDEELNDDWENIIKPQR